MASNGGIKLKMIFVIVLTASLMYGCATPSKVVPYGKDTYLISVDDVWGGHSPAQLQVNAAEKANEYCSKQGKVIRVRNADEHGCWGWTSTSSSLIFSCVDVTDYENTRPELRKDPNIIIENRQ